MSTLSKKGRSQDQLLKTVEIKVKGKSIRLKQNLLFPSVEARLKDILEAK